MILAVDPGTRGAGVALFDAYGLRAAAYIKNFATRGNGASECRDMARVIEEWVSGEVSRLEVKEVVVEWPRILSRVKVGKNVDQNDLLALAGVDSAVAATFHWANVVTVRPNEWKGTVDADVMLERIKGRLSEVERERIQDAGAKTHNAVDAVGIALWRVGRLEPKRVFSR